MPRIPVWLPMCASRDCSGVLCEAVDTPIIDGWDPDFCNTPCCHGMCSDRVAGSYAACCRPEHVGKRVYGRALCLLWGWRRNSDFSPDWSDETEEAYKWYQADMYSLHHVVAGTERTLTGVAVPVNSPSEDILASEIAISIHSKCGLFHATCQCLELSNVQWVEEMSDI